MLGVLTIWRACRVRTRLRTGTWRSRPPAVRLRTIDSALATARSIETSQGHGLSGVTAQALGSSSLPSLQFTEISGSSTQIAVARRPGGRSCLTSFQSSPAACVGVLLVSSRQAAPIFSEDPATAAAGTYYFEAPAPASLCNAITVVPPAPSYVSTTGFPSEPLR